MNEKEFIRAYRFFRAIVGRAAESALALARAEREANERGWETRCEREIESYRDVYGEDPPEGAEFVCVAVVDAKGECLGSLGFVEVSDKDYIRIVAAEIALEALRQTVSP